MASRSASFPHASHLVWLWSPVRRGWIRTVTCRIVTDMATQWTIPDEELQLEFWPSVRGLNLDDIRGHVPPAWFDALKALWEFDLTIWYCSEKLDGELLVRYQPVLEGGSRAALPRAAAIVAQVSRMCGACGQAGRPARLDRRRIACRKCAAAVRGGISWEERVARFWTEDGTRVTEPAIRPRPVTPTTLLKEKRGGAGQERGHPAGP